MTTGINSVATISADQFERIMFGGRLPRSAEFALMLENINRVEETPATRKRREFNASIINYIIRPFPSSEQFARGGKYQPRGIGIVGHSGPESWTRK